MATQHIGGRAEKELEPRRQDRPFLLADRATWLVDGLILPDEPHGRGNWRDHASLSSKRVIVIQPKVGPMGMFDGPSTLFRTLGARLRCSVGSFVPSARW